MPCDTIQKSSVNLELKADNKKFLIAALKSLGYQVQDLGETVRFVTPDGISAVFAKGKLTLTAYGQEKTFNVNPIKKAYSVEVVKATAKKFGWSLQQDKQNAFAFDVAKNAL